MRYCMFMASSLSRSLLMQAAASPKRMEEHSAVATPTHATMYDQSYLNSVLSA